MRSSSFRPKWHQCAAAVAVAFGLCALATPVAAQGFFDQLFGGFSKPSAPQQGGGSHLTPGGRAYPPGSSSSPFGRPVHQRSDGDDGDERGTRGGTYQTYCVRLCDGYYFPMSSSTNRRSFVVEQNRCAATCGSEARLFVAKGHSTHREAMTDLSGRPYGSLATAFKYRKATVAGCQCRGEPWSDSELGRHQSYAVAEAQTTTSQRRTSHTDAGAPMPRTVAAAQAAMAEEAAAAAAAARSTVKDGRAAPSPVPSVATSAVASPESRAEVVPAVVAAPVGRVEPRIPDTAPPLAVADASVPAAGKNRREPASRRVADYGPKPTAQRQQRSRNVQHAQLQNGNGGWGGSGLMKQPKMTWPGDAPARR